MKTLTAEQIHNRPASLKTKPRGFTNLDLRINLFDQMSLCRYSVPTTIVAEIKADKFFNLKRTASRTAYYIQAISRVLKDHPRVNASFVRKFWTNGSRIHEWDTVDCAVSIDRKFDGERFPFTYVLKNSDKLAVREIEDQIKWATQTEVKNIPPFKAYLDFLKLPRPVRKIFMHLMICDAQRMKDKIGTFNFTNLSGWGFKSASTISPRLLIGVSAPDSQNNLPIGYNFNHVISDGAQIGEYHRDLTRFFRRCEFT
jgi:hypothetical protein